MRVDQVRRSISSAAARELAPKIKLSALSVIKVGIGSLGFMTVALILSVLR